jgi:hypothetical protein
MTRTPPIKSLLVAVPTMGGIMKSKTAESLFVLSKALARNGIDADILNIDASDVVTARNLYANKVLNSEAWDALLFIDSDMQFAPRPVLKMLALKSEVAAVAYPKKKVDLDRFAAAVGEHGDIARARAESSDFNILLTWDNRKRKPLKRRGGFCSMAAAGLGCSLIGRTALQAMIEGEAVRQRTDVRNGVHVVTWGFFDHIKVGQIVLGEDFSFWYRWTQMLGRDLWVCVDEEIQHVGDYAYSGLYSSLLPAPRKA